MSNEIDLEGVEPEWRAAFLDFITKGKLNPAWEAHVESCANCRTAIEAHVMRTERAFKPVRELFKHSWVEDMMSRLKLLWVLPLAMTPFPAIYFGQCV